MATNLLYAIIQPDSGAPKKSTFDSLDKPELINKCKGLLQLAKSAKQTKDGMPSFGHSVFQSQQPQ